MKDEFEKGFGRGRGKGQGMGWRRTMRGRGLRITAPREAVMDVLYRKSTHMSAKEIYGEVLKIEPSAGLTTVYRTLEMLADMGIVSRVEIGDKTTRYEIKDDSAGTAHHHHIICTNCRKVIDYSDFSDEEVELFSKMTKNIEKKFNIKITGHNVQFFGICLEHKEE